jgi:hypothetical protein
MKHLIIAAVFSALLAVPLFDSTACAKENYVWQNVAVSGKGCFPPNCAEGKFPMAILPLVAFEGKLYSIGDKRIWTSDDGMNWTSQPKTDWGERYGQFAFFKNKLWMLGGMKTWDDFRNDVWSSADGKEWKQVVSKAEWSPRRWHGVIVFKDKLWILGGASSSGRRDQTPTEFLNDVWSSTDGVNWTLVAANAPWSLKDGHTSLVFDDKIWVIGGKRDVWSSTDGKNWTQVTDKAEWSERYGSGGLVFDGKIWIFGGREKNDVWFSSNGKNWQMAFEQAPWSTRSANYSVAFKDKIWLFSGKTGREDSWMGDIWTMNRKMK